MMTHGDRHLTVREGSVRPTGRRRGGRSPWCGELSPRQPRRGERRERCGG
ncbi:hypothetical protein ACFPM0_18270 [Pseudonocardia sulfidoxydans]